MEWCSSIPAIRVSAACPGTYCSHSRSRFASEAIKVPGTDQTQRYDMSVISFRYFKEAIAMNRRFLGFIVSALVGLPVLAALNAGDKAPDFSARASLAGKEFNFSLQDVLKKGPAVVYFYPSAYTKGCDLEAHTFAEQKEKFDAAGATIIGVSADSITRLNRFAADPDFCA